MNTNVKLMKLAQAESAFNILIANQTRLFLTLNLIVIQNKGSSVSNKDASEFMYQFHRKTDIFFTISENCWGIILTQGQKNEALAFLNRLFSQSIFENEGLHFVACSLEIRNDQAPFEKIIASALQELENNPQLAHRESITLDHFNSTPLLTVKASIIVAEPLFAETLQRALNQLNVPNFSFEVQVFEDGASFLSSNFYHSAHQHLILLDDILPRQNGMEVLHYIRQLPNARKFFIIMMSDRNTEQHAALAYENGVDNYFEKPLNHQLLMALLSRKLKRMWD